MAFFKALNIGSAPYMPIGVGPAYQSVKFLRNSDVFTAAKVVAQDIATNPIKLMQTDDNVISDDLNLLLNVKPNDYMTAWSFKFALACNLLFTGNAYARILKTKRGRLVELRLIKPSWVTIYQNEDESLYYDINDEDGRHYVLRQDEILHYKYFSTDGLIGVSPLYSLKDEMQIQDSGNKLLTNFFKAGLFGSSLLKLKKTEATPQALNAIRQKFIEANSNSRVVVMDETMDYQNIEVDTSILKLVNSNNYSTNQIAKAFGIPASKLGIEGAHTSITQANLDYIQNSLDHYFSVFNSENNVKLLASKELISKHFEFDVSRLLELDTQANIEESIKMFQNGGITHDEYRKRIGYKPEADKSKFNVMSNYIPMDKTQYTIKTLEEQIELEKVKTKGGETNGNTKSERASNN